MMEGHRVKLTEVNPYLVCVLCHGYLVDATTIAECLHSFCRSCIFRQLERKPICPICETQVHNTKLYRSLRPDKTLQDIVYKLVPGLFHNEMQRRRDFYKNHPFRDEHLESECRGVGLDRLIYSPDDLISLSLEFYDDEREKEEWSNQGSPKPAQTAPSGPKRYLQCPAGFKMRHLKKFLRQKYGLSPTFSVDILYKRETLPDSYSLVDVAYMYTWKRNSPMRFYYRMPEVVMKQLLTPPPEVPLIANDDLPALQPAEPLKEGNNTQNYNENSSEKTENKENVTQNHSETNQTVDSKISKKTIDSVVEKKSEESPKVDGSKEDKCKNGALSVSKHDELPASVLLALRGKLRMDDKTDEHKFLVPSVPNKNGLTEKKVNAKISPKLSLDTIATELAEKKSQATPIAPKEQKPSSPVQQQQLLQKQKQIQQQKQTYYQKQKQLQIKQQQMNHQKQMNQQKQQQLQLKQQQLAQQKQQIQQIIQQQQLQHQLQQQQLQQFHQQQLQHLQTQQQLQSQQPIHILQHQVQQQTPVMQQVLQMQQPQMQQPQMQQPQMQPQTLMQPQIHMSATSNNNFQTLNQPQVQVQNVVQAEVLPKNSQKTKKPQEQIVTSSVNTKQLQQSTPQVQTIQQEQVRNASPLQQTTTTVPNQNISPAPQFLLPASVPQSQGNQPTSLSTPPPPQNTSTPPPKVQTPPYTQSTSPKINTKMNSSTISTSPLVTTSQSLPVQCVLGNAELKSALTNSQTIQPTTQYQSNLSLMSGGNVNLTQNAMQSPQLINNNQHQKPWHELPRTDMASLNGSTKPKSPQVTLNTSNGSLTIMAQPKNAQNVSSPVNNETSNVLNGKPAEIPKPQAIHQNLPRTVLPKSPLVNGKAYQKAVPQKNISGRRLNNNLPDMKNGLIQQSNINNRLPTFQKGNARKTMPGAVASKTGPTLDQRIQQLYNAGQTNKPSSPGDGAKSESRLASWLNNRFKPPQSPKEDTDSTPSSPKSDVSVMKYKRKLQEIQKDCEITQENPRPDDSKRRREVMPDVSIELMRAADMKKLEGGKKEKRPVPGLKSIQEVGGKRKKEEDSALDLSSAKPAEGLRPQLPWLVNRPSHFIPRPT